jgi:hypothetical protein
VVRCVVVNGLGRGWSTGTFGNKELDAAANVAKVDLRAFAMRYLRRRHIWRPPKAGAGALAILEDPLSLGQWNEVVMRVSRLRLPAVYGYGEFAEAGVDDHDSRRRHHRIMSARLGALPRPSPGVDRDPGWASRVSSINHRD